MENCETKEELNRKIHEATKMAFRIFEGELPSTDDLYMFARTFIWALHKQGVGFTVQLPIAEDKKED